MAALPQPTLHKIDSLLADLDGLSVSTVNSMWRGPTSRVLLLVLRGLSQVDRPILRHLSWRLATDCAALEAAQAEAPRSRVDQGEGTYLQHPVVVTLLLVSQQQTRPPPAWMTLLAVLCELALRARASSDWDGIADLSSRLRGALDDYGERLGPILPHAKTVPEIQASIERHLQIAPGLNKSFESLWKRWLRDRIHGWILEDPAALREALRPTTFVPDLDAPAVPIDLGSSVDPDDSRDVTCEPTDPYEPGESERPPRVERARARASRLLRGGQGDLLTPASYRVPSELVTRQCRAALNEAKTRVAHAQLQEAEPFVAVALAMATGVRESELRTVVWGTRPTETIRAMVDPDQPVLWRRVVRPTDAFKPKAEMESQLEPVVDAYPWPLPDELHALLVRLHPTPDPFTGRTLLPRLSDPAGGYRLADTLRQLMPEAAIGSNRLRQALAAHIAGALGSDVAQLALGDAFAMSVAPTYYCAPRIGILWDVVSRLLSQWFEVQMPLRPPLEGMAFGTRLQLTDEAAARWPDALQHQRHSLARRKDATATDAWRCHRDYLAASLCVATGHRPNNALGLIDLDQIIPEYGLIILRDKQIDPLRKERVVVTGGHWTTELRAFLDRLLEIEATGGSGSELARSILRSESPLFSIPGPDGAEIFTAATLRTLMPAELREADNHYRHRLNGYLQNQKVDPELRFAQMGWVVSAAYATAELSPLAARDLSTALGPTIDSFLVHEGWFGRRHRIAPWRWDGIPLRPWRDWDAVVHTHEQAHKHDVARVRQELHERGRAVLEELLPRLERAVGEFLPGLRLDLGTRRLVPTGAVARPNPLSITEDLCGLVIDRVRQDDGRPSEALETVMTRIQLVRLLKRSHRDGLTAGFIPQRPILSVTAESSPFIPGLGLAVRQMDVARERLLARARANHRDDQGILAYLGVLLFSPYRDRQWADAAVDAAAKAVRGTRPADNLRVPAVLNRKAFPMVFSGLPALLLARRGVESPKAHAPNAGRISKWLECHIAAGFGPSPTGDLIDTLVATARAAARVELSGPERLLLSGGIALAPTSVERCLAAEDCWPLRITSASVVPDASESGQAYEVDQPATMADRPVVTDGILARLRALLDPQRFAQTRNRAGDSHHGWRGALRTALLKLQEGTVARSNTALLVGYTLHRLDFGGVRKRELAHQTLNSDVKRIARRLLQMAGQRQLLDQDASVIEHIYLSIVVDAPKPVRAETLESLRRFHDYIETVHQASSIDWDEVSATAGPRLISVDAGLLTPAEIEAIHVELLADAAAERSRPDAAPDLTRLAELRVLLYALLEASGIRPGSARGLMLGDLHLYAEGSDYVHVHRTGPYGSAKTLTSVGFVPLEGALWIRARGWVIDWIAQERKRIPGEFVWKTPLFADAPGSQRRYGRTLLQRRIGELVRWAAGERKAKVYWLRKTRVTTRHYQAAYASDPRARLILGVLRISSHASFGTPLTSYIADPAIPYAHSLIEGRRAPRSAILDITALSPGALDVAWSQRGGDNGERRQSITLDRLRHRPTLPPPRAYAPPPPLISSAALRPRTIDLYARARHEHSADVAMLLAGLSPRQGEVLEHAARSLVALRGQVPWAVDGLRHPRAVMRPPRIFAGAHQIESALDDVPDQELFWLAMRWASTGHGSRLSPDERSILLLDQHEEARLLKLLTRLGIGPSQVIVSMEGSGATIKVRRHPSATDEKGLSIMSVIAWLLAMVWLREQLGSSTALAPLSCA